LPRWKRRSARDRSLGKVLDMADYPLPEFEKIMAVIESAIDVAKQNLKKNEPVPSNDYLAWIDVNELRRAGCKIVPKTE